jgi:hypothetical protein
MHYSEEKKKQKKKRKTEKKKKGNGDSVTAHNRDQERHDSYHRWKISLAKKSSLLAAKKNVPPNTATNTRALRRFVCIAT